MPELPEVERGRRIAESACLHKPIESVFAAEDDIVFDGVAPERFAQVLEGRTVQALRRKGKQLWMELDRAPHPLFHFGMTGDFRAYTDPADRHKYCKVELVMADGVRLGMKNPRRLGRLRLREDPEHEPPLSNLGRDPYADPPTPKQFADLLARRKAPLKALLLDQKVLAGVGNWIADEALYQAKLAPERRACDLSTTEAKRLLSQTVRVVAKAVEVDADKRKFPRTWLFHQRWKLREDNKGNDVRDAKGDRIEFLKVGGRTTAWVPARQA
ncbi:MAG: DNA-formamidopyrimidine glycosylase family protein [Planctomycetota bacterium]